MTDPTTAEGRALLPDGITSAIRCTCYPPDPEAEPRADMHQWQCVVAAAEAERARIWAALSKPHQAWCSALLGACDCGHDAAAVLAAIDAPGTGETLHERQVRLNYERPGRAAIDDEAKTPEWRDDSGHWIGGNVGMPEAAAEAERARIIRLTLWAMREVGPRLLTTPADQEAAFRVVAPLVLAAIDDPRADGRLTEAYADGYVDGRMDAAIDDEAKG